MLEHACRQELVSKPTTLEEDESMLQGEQAASDLRMWNALQLRMGHKRLLQHCTSQADTAAMFLETQRMANKRAVSDTHAKQPAAGVLHQEL